MPLLGPSWNTWLPRCACSEHGSKQQFTQTLSSSFLGKWDPIHRNNLSKFCILWWLCQTCSCLRRYCLGFLRRSRGSWEDLCTKFARIRSRSFSIWRLSDLHGSFLASSFSVSLYWVRLFCPQNRWPHHRGVTFSEHLVFYYPCLVPRNRAFWWKWISLAW